MKSAKTPIEATPEPEISIIEFAEIEAGNYLRPVQRPEGSDYWLKVRSKTESERGKFLSCSIEEGLEQYSLSCLAETEWLFERKV